MRSLYRVSREELLGIFKRWCEYVWNFHDVELLQATEMSLANDKIQDVIIRTRCTGSYCNALPPERSDYVYLTMTNAKGKSRRLCSKLRKFQSFHPRFTPFGDVSRTYITKYTISFLALFHSSIPFRRVRILKRIEAPRFHNSVSPQFDTLQIIGAVTLTSEIGFNNTENIINLRFMVYTISLQDG